MDVRNRRSVRQIILCAAVPASLALAAVFAPSPAAAYTEQQRAACEGDAMRLCSEHVPNVDRITACMRAKQRHLSAGCRAVFGGGASKRRIRANR
jgi:hypothetical protein